MEQKDPNLPSPTPTTSPTPTQEPTQTPIEPISYGDLNDDGRNKFP